MDKFPHFDFYRTRFTDLFRSYEGKWIEHVGSIVSPQCETIARTFYRVMLNDKRALVFLNYETVQKRLVETMTTWLRELFVPRSESAIDDYVDRQLRVGNVHARINLPITLIDYGVIIIKRELSERLMASSLEGQDRSKALVYMNSMIDLSIMLINETYFTDVLKFERGAQSLRVQASNTYLAYECEQIRSSLYDWFRQVLTALHQPDVRAHSIPDIHQSDFGLWLTHKGKLIFSNKKEVDALERFIDELDRKIGELVVLHNQGDWGGHAEKVRIAGEDVTKAGWLLDSLAKEVLESESGRDSLTQLFNRRYLPNILAHEVTFNAQQGTQFAVLYIDIDHFKSINDTFGHEKGDAMLVDLAGLLLHSVRAGDYVFRYGGEEFLVVLTAVSPDRAVEVAEKLRAECEGRDLQIIDAKACRGTISIGVALTEEGQRDYEKVIARADQALMRAKQEGRNRVVLDA